MKKTLLALIVGLALLIPSSAFADCKAYGTKTCPPTSNTTSTTAPAPTTPTTAPTAPTPTSNTAPATGSPTASSGTTSTTTSSGTLPFTGLDLVALLGGATVLLGAGLIVRHLSRDQHN